MQVKLLGELYNYRIFEHGVIFDCMHEIIELGHPHGVPSPVPSLDDEEYPNCDLAKIPFIATFPKCLHCHTFDPRVTTRMPQGNQDPRLQTPVFAVLPLTLLPIVSEFAW
jgi:hypothetical protein